MSRFNRGKNLVGMVIQESTEDRKPFELNQWAHSTRLAPHSSIIDSLWFRPYSMDIKFKEYLLSDSESIDKILSTPKDAWEQMFKLDNSQHENEDTPQIDLTDNEQSSVNIFCYEEMVPSVSDVFGCNTLSAIHKSYVPPVNMSQNNFKSKEDNNQFITYSLPPTVRLPESVEEHNHIEMTDKDFNSNYSLKDKNYAPPLNSSESEEVHNLPISYSLPSTVRLPESVEVRHYLESSSEDFDSDDSVKDKDYVPSVEMPQNSSDSEEDNNQSISNFLSPTIHHDKKINKQKSDLAEDEELYFENGLIKQKKISKKVITTKNLETNAFRNATKKIETLLSLCRKAIIYQKQEKQPFLNTCNDDTRECSGQEKVTVYSIVEQETTTSPEDNIIINSNLGHVSEVTVEKEKNTTEQLYTKSGKLRKRKTFQTSLKERQLAKKTKYIEKHAVKEGCKNSCLKKCNTMFSEEDRKYINNYYWTLKWREQRIFLKQSARLATPKRKVTTPPRRHARRTFFFQKNGQHIEVCKHFLLTTLGYKSSNDKVLYNALSEEIAKDDMRGKHAKTEYHNRESVIQHIQSFHPTNSHHRREHAPKRKYLPSDLTVKSMHADFIEKHPDFKISYDFYRKVVKSLNISFTQLGHEECEICEAHNIHCKSENHDKDSISDDCEKCSDYRNHKSRALKARKLYKKHKEEKDKEPNHIYYSTDLEKVIMLPRLETFKEVVFCQRLVAFNQTFAPLGQSDTNPYAVLWHEAIAGRKQEDIISAFNVFLLHCRDYDFIDLWLDNCAAQNKNWLLYFYLVHIINSNEINAKQVILNYFEPGHTHMSCDHFHHQVELSMKRKKKLHDFQDFIEAVSAANSAKVTVREMKTFDFINVNDYTSSRRIQTSNPRAYMRNMVQVIFKRGSFNLFYKTDFDGELNELTFLKDTYLKSKKITISVITSRTNPRGIKTTRKENILKKLSKFMLPYKQTFWKNLPTNDNEKTDSDEE